MNSKWQRLWNDRGRKYKGQSSRILDGWDSGIGRLTKEDLVKISLIIKNKLELKKEDKLLEVGCGAGMTLSKLAEHCDNISGIDYAESLIGAIQEQIPNGRFMVNEAKDICFGIKFDKIYSFSVFQYFQNYEYAIKVLESMLRNLNPHGKIIICDIPNLDTKTECERCRGANLNN